MKDLKTISILYFLNQFLTLNESPEWKGIEYLYVFCFSVVLFNKDEICTFTVRIYFNLLSRILSTITGSILLETDKYFSAVIYDICRYLLKTATMGVPY